jgi:hypothetical protein
VGKIGRVRTLIAPLVPVMFLVACATAPAGKRSREAPPVHPGEAFTLALGGTVQIDATNYWLMFDAVREDSRCPREVSCVWEGNAHVSLTLREAIPGKTRGTLYEVVDTPLDLNTSSRFEQRQKVPGGFISLRGLGPQPPIEDPKLYVAALFIEPSK